MVRPSLRTSLRAWVGRVVGSKRPPPSSSGSHPGGRSLPASNLMVLRPIRRPRSRGGGQLPTTLPIMSNLIFNLRSAADLLRATAPPAAGRSQSQQPLNANRRYLVVRLNAVGLSLATALIVWTKSSGGTNPRCSTDFRSRSGDKDFDRRSQVSPASMPHVALTSCDLRETGARKRGPDAATNQSRWNTSCS